MQVLDHGPVHSAHLLGGQRRDRAAAHSTHRPLLSGVLPARLRSTTCTRTGTSSPVWSSRRPGSSTAATTHASRRVVLPVHADYGRLCSLIEVAWDGG